MIKHFLSISRLSPKYLWLNIKLNYFSKNVIRHNNAHIFIYRDVIIDIDRTAIIELWGDLILGVKSIRGNRQVSKLYMAQNSCITIEEHCSFLDGFDVQVHKNGRLKITQFHSNIGLEISCGNAISIGKDVIAGRHVRIKDYNGHWVSYEGYPLSAPISISEHVWLCTGSTINPGVSIGYGSVISDNTNVIEDVAPRTFIQGNPSVVKEENIVFKM